MFLATALFAFGIFVGYVIRAQDGDTFFQRTKNYFNLYKRPKG